MRARSLFPLLLLTLLALLAFGAARVTAGPGCTITFDGNGTTAGAWGTAANWDTDVLPASTDHVCVPAGLTAALTTPATVQTVQVAGALTIGGSGALAVTDTVNESTIASLTMSSGDLAGAGSLALTGSATLSGGDLLGTGTLRVASGATMTIANGSPYQYAERPVAVEGILELATAHGINSWNGIGVIHVRPGGRIRGSAASGSAFIASAIDNDGLVEATSGILSLRGGSGGQTSSGAFGGGAGFVDFDAQTQTLAAGGRLLGNARVSGGGLGVADGATAQVSGDNSMSTGDLNGPGTLALTAGNFSVSGGDIQLAARVAIGEPATMTVSGGSPYLYVDSRIEVAGVLALASAHGINDWNGKPQIRVAPTGVLRASAPSGIAHVAPSIDNDGLVEATSGVLALRGGSAAETSTGAFGGGAGIVDFDLGTQTLGEGADLLTGARISGGTVGVASGATAHGAGAIDMTSGDLAGPGTFSLDSGTLAVSAGDFSENLRLRIAPGATMAVSGGSPYLYVGSHIEVEGLLALLTAHGINDWNGKGTIRVAPGGVLRGSAASGGIAYVTPAVDNDGLVEATGGVLNLRGGSAAETSSGRFGGGAGFVDFDLATHRLAGGAQLLGNARVSGGTVEVEPDAVATASGDNAISSGTIGGAGTLRLASGSLAVSGGSMSGAGTTEIAAGATLSLTGNLSLSTGRAVKVSGTLEIAGDRGILRSTTAPEPHVHVLDGGVLRKTAGSLTGFVEPGLRNDGLVDSSAGRLELRRGSAAAHTGDFDGDSATAHTSLRNGTHVLGEGARLLGHAEIGGGTVQIPAGVTVPVPDQARQGGGTITGAGTLDVTGTLTWAGGTQQGPGTTRVAAAATLVVDGCTVNLRDGRLLDAAGTLRVLRQSDISTWGTPAPVIAVKHRLEFDDTEAGTCGTLNGVTGTAIVRNTGTIEKLAGATSTRVDALLDNDGVVSASAGSLYLGSDETATHAGAFGADGAAGNVEFGSGTFILEPTATVAGNAGIADATVQLPEDMTLTVGAGRTFTQNGGVLSGAGELRVLGTLVWNDGEQRGGTTVIEREGTVALGGSTYAYHHLGEGRVFVNRGTTSLSVGELSMSTGSSILNQGVLELADGTELYGNGNHMYGNGSLIHNTGVLRKMGGTGTATVWPALDNDGTVEVAGGTLTLLGQIMNASTRDGSFTGGTWIARNATLGVSQPIEINAAELVLDGDQSRVMTTEYDGTLKADALANLSRNAGAGRIRLLGGRDLSIGGPFHNGGVVSAAGASTITVAGAYEQSAGLTTLADTARLTATGAQVRLTGGRLSGRGSAGPLVAVDGGVLEPGTEGAGTLALDALTLGGGATTRMRLSGSGNAQLAVTGAATLAGTVEVVKAAGFAPAAGNQFLLAGYGSRTGAFGAITGDGPGSGLQWQLEHGATQVHLVAASTPSARATAPQEAPAPAPAAEPAPAPLAPVRIDNARLTATSGRWTRRAGLSIARSRGATLVRRGVSGRRLALVAATCRACGSLDVYWGGKRVARVSLRSSRPGRRTLRLANLRQARRGTVRLRTRSARRVAVDALLVG